MANETWRNRIPCLYAEGFCPQNCPNYPTNVNDVEYLAKVSGIDLSEAVHEIARLPEPIKRVSRAVNFRSLDPEMTSQCKKILKS